MKLLFIHDRIGAQAGAESNLFHTAVEMGRRGHQVALAHGPGTGIAEDSWKDVFGDGYRLNPETAGSDLQEALTLCAPDAVYLHNPPGEDVVEVLAEADAPVVRMVHDHNLFCLRGCRYPVWSRRPCRRPLGLFCVFLCGGLIARGKDGSRGLQWSNYRRKQKELQQHKRFCRLVVASSYMRDELMLNGFTASRIEIHPPVPPDPTSRIEPSFGVSNRLVYAGQIVRGKGVDVLLRALAQVREPFTCTILGDGHHRSYCEALSRRLGLSDRVQFRGYVPQSELTGIYEEATMAVVSSVWPEPFGATGLEAMRCGLPVVAFDAGGIGDWLQDGVNGFLVPWMDCAQYARRIDTLLADKALARKLGGQGRRIAAETFGFDDYLDGLEELFTRVAAESLKGAVA